MAAKDLKKIKIFKETGLFEVKSRRRKKSIALTSVEVVAVALQERMSSGV